MKEKARLLYDSLQQELRCCKEKNLCIVAETEYCYTTANKYWELLKHEVSEYEFEKIEEEIEFFKKGKPLFTSEIVYYEFLYHIEFFKPEKQEELYNLLLWEKDRLSKFIWKNTAFYEYYKSGETNMDEIYFVRANSDLSNFPCAPVYDLDAKGTTSHDYLIARIIALERYDRYVQSSLVELTRQIKNRNLIGG
jgi:hypothetical protein